MMGVLNKRAVPVALLEMAGDLPTFRDRIAALKGGKGAKGKKARAESSLTPVEFSHVTESGQAFLVALLASELDCALWVVCENLREQERVHNELLTWHGEALFLPEMETAIVENSIPDPEITAERLEILQRLAKPGRKVVVLTRASLEGWVPVVDKKQSVRVARAQRVDREALIGKLAKAGYENVPQVALRGQFSVRGGILDVFSWQMTQPVRLEFFDEEVESIRSFDLDVQTSFETLDVCEFLVGDLEQKLVPLRSYVERGAVSVELGGNGAVDESSRAGTEPSRPVNKGSRAGNIPSRSATEYMAGATESIRGATECSEPGINSVEARLGIFEEGVSLLEPGMNSVEPGVGSVEAGMSPVHAGVESVGESFGARVTILEGSNVAEGAEDFSGAFYPHDFGEMEAGDLIVEEGKREALFRQLREWDRAGWRLVLFCNNEGESERFQDLLHDHEVELKGLTFAEGNLTRGFTLPDAKLAVLTDGEIFGRYQNNRSRRLALRRARVQAQRSQIDFSELTEGDFVVHLEHGIGRFLALETFEQNGSQQEVLVLEFSGESKLYVPLEQAFLVSRYVGVGKRTPDLSALGDAKWGKAKKAAEKAVFDYASRLLVIQAERETTTGYAFPPDGKWQHEFESAFLYKETADQLTAIAAAKEDMESTRPMDRLICGDVGFGKTEVAIRAAFKSVMGGKQVAILVPTTVLAQQHYQTFRERMSDYPVTIEMMSRFRTAAEQKKTAAGLTDGTVDIVIGTHRLISKDIAFKDLGLVVVDEEQRFGVLHKEKFKELFKKVDVLTLSATPIPRTLYLSLMGARDMSVIETPPQNRLPVETVVCGYDERIIRDAINRELARQGQVYFLHNRVMTIEKVASRVRELCPQARVRIGHGQMHEHELEDVMRGFIDGEADVLISTTIIESGIDIPNANTIIIDRADRFGLADLYQLRGRVGRAQHKAYAYLMLPRDLMTVGAARKRVNAIKQYSTLGAGFKIAMRDLEIRGAGNVLGTAQSGHIITVGFDLYCQLLRQAVSKMKGEKVKPRIEITLRLDSVSLNESEWFRESHLTPAFLPTAYISEPKVRIAAYRAHAEVNNQEQLDKLRKTWRDRFGPLPQAAENLLQISRIKLAAAATKITRVEVREGKVMLTRGGDYILLGGKFPRLTSKSPEIALSDLLALLNKF